MSRKERQALLAMCQFKVVSKMNHFPVQKLKRYAKCLLGKDFLQKYDCKISSERLGDDYGGWHVHTEKLSADSIIYSFGIGEDISFDLDLIAKYNAHIHGFDPTPESNQWVADNNFPDSFMMHEYGLADRDGTITFFTPKHPDLEDYTLLEGSTTIEDAVHLPVKRLTTVMKELGHDHIDLLKMDIEGAEFGVIEDFCNSDIRPGQILVEFHHMFKNISIEKTKQSLQLLRDSGYGLFYVSNSGYEYSFIYQDKAGA